jgi:hypothetical protein
MEQLYGRRLGNTPHDTSRQLRQLCVPAHHISHPLFSTRRFVCLSPSSWHAAADAHASYRWFSGGRSIRGSDEPVLWPAVVDSMTVRRAVRCVTHTYGPPPHHHHQRRPIRSVTPATR